MLIYGYDHDDIIQFDVVPLLWQERNVSLAQYFKDNVLKLELKALVQLSGGQILDNPIQLVCV